MIPPILLDCQEEWPIYKTKEQMMDELTRKEDEIIELKEQLEDIKGRIAWWVECMDTPFPSGWELHLEHLEIRQNALRRLREVVDAG